MKDYICKIQESISFGRHDIVLFQTGMSMIIIDGKHCNIGLWLYSKAYDLKF